MIEFVGLTPILENHIVGCHALSHSSYQNVLGRTLFRIQRIPLNTLARILKAIGVQGRSHLNPSPRLTFLRDFLSFYIHAYANEIIFI